MVTLKPMNQTQYQQFLDRAIIDFAKDKVDAGTWEEAQSLQKSQDIKREGFNLGSVEHLE